MRNALAGLSALALSASLATAAAAPAPFPFSPGTKADEATIRAILADRESAGGDGHEAANLDWENAFGIRYNDLSKLDAFYGRVVKPLQAQADKSTLEIKVRFITPVVAVADRYWHVVGQLDVHTRKRGADRWGRTTDVFVKSGATWTAVVERVADLRLPYYKHLDAPPAPAAIPSATLALYAGTYQSSQDMRSVIVHDAGDHLMITTSRHGTLEGVPRSATEFTAFDPNDLAQYYDVAFLQGQDGTLQLSIRDPWEGAEATNFLRRK